MRKADRLFEIIQILRRSKKPVTADAMAAELETSKRSVYRDIAELLAQRVSIRGEAGIGYVLDKGLDMPPLMLTPDELEAAVLGAGWVAQRGDAALARGAQDLIAKLTHEMRNPLNAIVGFAEIMQQAHFGRLGDLRYEAYAGEIRINAEELLSLVNDLLDLAQIEAGQLRLDFDGLALSSLVEDCVRLLRPEAMKNGVSLETSIPEALPAFLRMRAR